jgi:hypothetical protein
LRDAAGQDRLDKSNWLGLKNSGRNGMTCDPNVQNRLFRSLALVALLVWALTTAVSQQESAKEPHYARVKKSLSDLNGKISREKGHESREKLSLILL